MIFLQDTGNKLSGIYMEPTGSSRHPATQGTMSAFQNIWMDTRETSIKTQILKEATFYLLCIKTFNIKLYHLMPETKGTRITCLEQQYTSQTAFKQDKYVKILATLREIKNRQSTKFKDFSPRAIPSATKSSIHARKSEIYSSIWWKLRHCIFLMGCLECVLFST